MSVSRAMKPVRNVRCATERQSGSCPAQPSGKDFMENQAICQIAKILVGGVARTQWTHALYDALGEAQRVQGRGEREHLARAFKELSH